MNSLFQVEENYGYVSELEQGLRNCGRTKKEIREVVHGM